jgi:hypothetical protein
MQPAIVIALGFLLFGCGDDPGEGEQCVENLPTTCDPAFTPTWTSVYDKVIRPSCGGTGSGASCHAAEGKQGGLELSSSDGSLSALLGEVDGKPRVLSGDPACSILVGRIESSDPARRMPLGGQLNEATRCAVRQWIEMGAAP